MDNVKYCYRYSSTGLSVRKIQQEKPIWKGYYLTEEEAKEVWKNRQNEIRSERKALEPEANKLLKEKAEVIRQAINDLEKSLDCEIVFDGDAHDSSGLETYLTISINLKGHYFFYHLHH